MTGIRISFVCLTSFVLALVLSVTMQAHAEKVLYWNPDATKWLGRMPTTKAVLSPECEKLELWTHADQKKWGRFLVVRALLKRADSQRHYHPGNQARFRPKVRRLMHELTGARIRKVHPRCRWIPIPIILTA